MLLALFLRAMKREKAHPMFLFVSSSEFSESSRINNHFSLISWQEYPHFNPHDKNENTVNAFLMIKVTSIVYCSVFKTIM